MTWTTPAHGNPNVARWNAQVADNLTHLHAGNGIWLPTPSTDMTAKVLSNNFLAFLAPTVARDVMTVRRMAYRSDTTGTQVDMGIYLDDGNGTTCSKLATTEPQAMPAGPGTKVFNLVNPVNVTPGTKYWLAISFPGGGAAVLGTTGPLLGLARRASKSYPLQTVVTFDPNTLPTASPCLAALP